MHVEYVMLRDQALLSCRGSGWMKPTRWWLSRSASRKPPPLASPHMGGSCQRTAAAQSLQPAAACSLQTGLHAPTSCAASATARYFSNLTCVTVLIWACLCTSCWRPRHDSSLCSPPQVLSETIEAHSEICAVLDRALGVDMSTDERLLVLAALMAGAGVRRDDADQAALVDACRQAAALRPDGTMAPLSTCQACFWECWACAC